MYKIINDNSWYRYIYFKLINYGCKNFGRSNDANSENEDFLLENTVKSTATIDIDLGTIEPSLSAIVEIITDEGVAETDADSIPLYQEVPGHESA